MVRNAWEDSISLVNMLIFTIVVREGPEPHEGAQDPEARPQHLRR
jgi:hypothetical protein